MRTWLILFFALLWANSTAEAKYSSHFTKTLGSNVVTAYNYDSAWRLTNLTSTIASGFIYQYLDARPQMPTAIYLPNGATITNTFDSLTRLKSTALKDHWGHTLDGYTYSQDALGLKTNILRDLGLTTSTVSVGFDSINQITNWTAQEPGGQPRLNEQLNFAYDAADNLHTRNNGGLSQTFTTDAANQLNSISRSGTHTLAGATPAPATGITVNGLTAQTYSDLTFARTNLTLTNGVNTFTVIATNAYGVRATNTLTVNLPASVTLFNDNNGSLTNDGVRSYGFDAENQMTNAQVAGQWRQDYLYDGLNRRRIIRDYVWTNSAWFKTGETRLILDGDQIIQERDASNNALVTYTRGLDFSGSLSGLGGVGGLLARTDASGTAFYHADGSGNITALMDAREQMVGRYQYGPFNKLNGMWGRLAPANVMRSGSMPGQNGMVFYPGNSYLTDPSRWASRDPAGELFDTNPYRFVYNNPVNFIDPNGLWGVQVFGVNVGRGAPSYVFGSSPTWADKNGNLHYNTPPTERVKLDPNSFGALHGFETDFGGKEPDELLTDMGKGILFDAAMLPLGLEREGANLLGAGGKVAKCENVVARGIAGKDLPGKSSSWIKLKGNQGWKDANGNFWKKDMKHKDHWDVSDRKGDKIKEIDFNGDTLWPSGQKTKTSNKYEIQRIPI